MVDMVFDKLMEYRIVDLNDIITWCFDSTERKGGSEDISGAPGVLTFQEWDLVKAALDKSIGRVAIAQNRVQVLRKEDEDAKAKIKAGHVYLDDDEGEEEDSLSPG